MKKLLSLFLVLALVVGLLPIPLTTQAADTIPEALSEVKVYADGVKHTWLTHSGSIIFHEYTYYNYISNITGEEDEIPAYCVNPTLNGVGEVVDTENYVIYNADCLETDKTVVAIISNGYPHSSLGDLGLENKHEGYYATKTALWCHIQTNWSIDNLAINPNLNSADKIVAQRVLDAVKTIYWRAMNWEINLTPSITATPDQSTAYPVTINGENYLQQVFHVNSATWCDQKVINVSFATNTPAGSKIVDLENNEISAVTMDTVGDGSVASNFKVLYPASSVEEQSGTVQINLEATVAQYAIYYAICAETDKYGNVQDYLVDTDPFIPMSASTQNVYSDSPTIPDGGNLRIIKLQNGTEIPLSGAVFEVITPSGAHLGSFVTNSYGLIALDVTEMGNYTITELTPPKNHNLGTITTQNVVVKVDETAEVTFWNDPYGSLKILKVSNTGDKLDGVTFQIKHIATGETHTGTTTYGGEVIFSNLPLGGYEVREIAGIEGYVTDLETVKTVKVVSDEVVSVSFVNEEMPGLKIIKYDRVTMIRLPNVTFDVKFNGSSIGQYTTDQLGEIILLDLPVGTYTITEVQSDNDHVTDGTSQQIYLDSGMGIVEFVFFNDLKPEMKLVKLDSSDLSVAIPNVKFEIKSVDGTYGPVEYITDGNGEINLSHLDEGAYIVTELQTPEGYIIDEAQRIIELRANQTAEFVFTNSKMPELKIIKTDILTGDPIGGVTFSVKKADGETVATVVTDENGEATILNIDEGVYEVTEQSVPEGYILDTTPQLVTLFANKTAVVRFQNYPKGTLELTKVDVEGKMIPNAVFNISAKDGTYSQDFTTDKDGKFLVDNLVEGYYIITEKSVPSPYILDTTPREVYVGAGKNITITVENERHPNLTIKKVDSITGSALSGAQFTVWYAVNGSLEGDLRKIGTYTTNSSGEIELEGLDVGWYRIEETKAPSGYSTNSNNVQDVFLKADVDQTITFENTPLGALIIKKVDATTGEVLQGAKFRLRYFSGVSGTEGTVIGEYETDVTGTIIITGLEKGTYMIQEFLAPEGYIIDDAPQTVYMTGDNQDVLLIEFENMPDSSLIIVKEDALTKELLQGAVFKVEDSSGAVVGNYDGIYTTDDQGSIYIPNLPVDTYVVTEIKAPDGYVLDSMPQTVKLIAGETHRIFFSNMPDSGLIIMKQDADTKAPLGGAVFKVTRDDGVLVGNGNGLYTTDVNGMIHITGLATDTYVVQEVTAPDGYVLDTTPQTIKLSHGETHHLYFYNSPIPEGGLLIRKLDADDRTPIEGVEFKIAKKTGDLVGNYITDENGLISLPDLEPNWYTVYEVKAADGYVLDGEPRDVQVKDQEQVTLEITNRKQSAFLIHKVCSITGEGLQGVTFLLSDSKNNPLGQYVSDSNGYVLMDDDLADGQYFIRELSTIDGYILDDTLRTFYVKYGETALITWENVPQMGQLQITKKSADANPYNGMPAGTLLPDAVFEIISKKGVVVDTVKTDSYGRAVSKMLPLGQYTIREIEAPMYYMLDITEIPVEIEFVGQIVKVEMINFSAYTNVSIDKTGYTLVTPNQTICYDITNIANNSTVALDSFYWRDTLPVSGATATKIVTGTYNQQLSYKVVYKTNLNDYRTLSDNLSTSKNNVLEVSPVALGLASNEYITDIMFVFGNVMAGFRQVETAQIYCTTHSSLTNGF
ncbi:MAG: SpaA isopeptide-forming pilin-related protein, partial [Eubacteriales bacterium]